MKNPVAFFSMGGRSLAVSLSGMILLSSGALAARDAGLTGEFLNGQVGARPMSMGGAFTAVSDDVDAVYWNPAGMSSYRSNQVSFEYNPLPVSGSLQYLGYSQPLYGAGSVGGAIANVTSGSIPRFTNVGGNPVETGSFSDRQTAYLFSYAHRVKENFGAGATVKMAEHAIDGRSARGFGADVGALYRTHPRLQFGLMVRNLLPPQYKYDTGRETFPTVIRAGTAATFFSRHLLAALDLDKTIGAPQTVKWHLGLEGYAIQNIFLRLGAEPDEFTGGIGVRFKTMQFDYGAGFQNAGLINRVSFKVLFGGYEVDVKASPAVFSPVGLKNKTTFKIRTSNRFRVVKWILAVRNSKGDVVRTFQGFNAPLPTLEWDGKDSAGRILDSGEYSYRMTVTDSKNKSESTPVRALRIQSPTPFEIEAK